MNKEHFLVCKDHSVTKEEFKLIKDVESDMLVTTPQPDAENLFKYYDSDDYISHTDSKRSLFEKVYQLIKQYSLHKKLRIINRFSPSKGTLLDVGAGTGDFLQCSKKGGWQIQGVEPNIKARKLADEKGVHLLDDIDEVTNQKFDVITLWHVLEHIPNLESYIIKLKGLLKDNGILVIAVPNYKSYDAKYYKEFWAAYDVPRHLWHFSIKSIKFLFSKEKMKVVKILPMVFDSYYVSLLSEKYKTGKMNYINALFVASVSNLKAKFNKNYSSLIYIIKK